MIDVKKFNENIGAIVSIVAILVGAYYGLMALADLPFVGAIVLVISPLISYLIIKYKVAIFRKSDYIAISTLIFLISCMVTIMGLQGHEKHLSEIKNVFIPGRIIKTSEFIEGGEDDNGNSWEDHYEYSYSFRASSKNYQIFSDIITWVSLIVSVGFPYINFRLLNSVLQSTSSNRTYYYDNDY